MSENLHVPVFPDEVLEAFRPIGERPEGSTIVDGTLGGAGHTNLFLDAFPKLRILGCDLDENAIHAARERLTKFLDRTAFFHGSFANVVGDDAKLPAGYESPWDGIFLDLGYSSNQLADPAYGMSFTAHPDAPLDMRLTRPPTGDSAWDILRDTTDGELADILFAYAEIRDSRRISRMIHEAISSGEVTNSTQSLASFLDRIDKNGRDKIHPATLVFQALRIAVNDELRCLDQFLENAILSLKPTGILAIITFHSLEDRLVKRWGQSHSSEVEGLTKKPIEPTEDETRRNPRARSAKLRVYRKR